MSKIEFKNKLKNDYFSVDFLYVEDKHERTVIRYNVGNVVIFPYTTDDKGNIDKILVIDEYNPLREGNKSLTLITGSESKSDETPLETAIRELEEESGYKIKNPSKWTFLGDLTTSKIIDVAHSCFAVDITDIKAGKLDPKSEIEKNSKAKLVKLEELKNSNDAFILSLMFKMMIHLEN